MNLFLFIFVLFLAQPSYAETDLSEGYDENTEITVSGVVIDISSQKRGTVILKLRSGRRIYYVVTAPMWFFAQHDIVFRSGLVIEVKGSKYFGRDGIIYIISREIRDTETGKRIILRDLQSRPAWGRQGMNRKQP